MSPRESTLAVIDALHSLAKHSNLGVSGTTSAISRDRNFFRERRRAGRIDLGTILQVLECFSIHPADFFGWMFPREGQTHDPFLEALRKDMDRLEGVELPFEVPRRIDDGDR